MHDYLYEMGYPEYVLKPYSILLVFNMEGEKYINSYTYDKSGYDEILEPNLYESIHMENEYILLLVAMPLGKNGKDIRKLYELNVYSIDMAFYNNIAYYLQHFISNYYIYLLDIKLDNMVLYSNEIKFIDIDFVCKVRDNIDDLNVSDAAKEYYKTISDCVGIKLRYTNAEWDYHAPEIKRDDWNVNPSTTLSWNIGWMIFNDLWVVYRKCDYKSVSYDRIVSFRNNLSFIKNIALLITTQFAETCAESAQELELIKAKQSMLTTIIPLPPEGHFLWKHNCGMYSEWNPNKRISLLSLSVSEFLSE